MLTTMTCDITYDVSPQQILYFLPMTFLASIVLVAVSGLANTSVVLDIYRTKRSDLVLWCVSFASTLILGVANGLVVSICASVAGVIWQSSRPEIGEPRRIHRFEVTSGSDVGEATRIYNLPKRRSISSGSHHPRHDHHPHGRLALLCQHQLLQREAPAHGASQLDQLHRHGLEFCIGHGLYGMQGLWNGSQRLEELFCPRPHGSCQR